LLRFFSLDITVVIDVTSVESNSSETNSNGAGQAGDEIATPTVRVVESFVIPIDPVIQGTPNLTITELFVKGPEDTEIDLGPIRVELVGIEDLDHSEVYYVEIDKSSYPAGTQFLVDGTVETGTTMPENWLRLLANAARSDSSISIRPPNNFSGIINLALRGIIVDSSTKTSVSSVTPTQTIEVSVSPVADIISIPSNTVGVEDEGKVAFGSVLATSGIQPEDDGTGIGNNAESETISQIKFVVPSDTLSLTYDISGPFASLVSGTFSANETAQVGYVETTRTYVITSTIISTSADVSALTQAEREKAEKDIIDTLVTFGVEIGPTHTDNNGAIAVTVTTLDVNIGEHNTKDNDFSHIIVIQAVADAPNVFAPDPIVAVSEDGANIPLNITVMRSADDDNSETLFVFITVPKDPSVPIGTIVGVPPNGVILRDKGDGLYLVKANGSTPLAREAALNSFLDGGGIAFDPRDNFSGIGALRIQVMSREDASGSELADGSFGGEDNTSKSEKVTTFINIEVLPVADVPTVEVKGNAAGLEDTNITVPVGVSLSDVDGSEQYIMTIRGNSILDEAKIYGVNGNEILKSGGNYTLQPADVDALLITPPLHWSSALQGQGNIVLQTTTIVTDVSANGRENVMRFDFNISVQITGVSNKPNSKNVLVVANEDEDYLLGKCEIAGMLLV
jgi:hypothetical protein